MFAFLFFALLSNSARALTPDTPAPLVSAPEIVITGKRLRGDHRSARVYTETELARESGRTIGEVLRESAGVDYIAGTGGNSNLLIRGSSGSQTLVIIDGVKANDPSATNRYFDWSRIDVDQIERVEILKGPQAVSYGSDAIGGVVLITTKRGEAGSITAKVEAGSEEFARARTSFGMEVGPLLGGDHELEVQALGKGVFHGGSSALSPTGAPVEGDNSREASAGLALKSRWGRDTRSTFTADLRAANEDIDAGPFMDDPNDVARNREIRAAINVEGKVAGGVEWGFIASHLDFKRAYSDYPDPMNAGSSDFTYTGTNSRAEFHLRSEVDSAVEWTTGFEATREFIGVGSLLFPTVLTRDHAETYALFAEGLIPLNSTKTFSIDFGARLSNFSSYGNQWSEKGGLNYKPMEGFELDAGVSTGFKAPSLYSLYEPTSGNTDLKPEESTQVEAGVISHPTTAGMVSMRGFSSQIRNRFGYNPNPPYKSLNVARAKIRGVEIESEMRLCAQFRIAPSLTYLSTRDEATGQELTDQARWKSALKFAYDLSSAHSITLSVVAKSNRGSSVGNSRVAGFYRADLTTRHRLTQAWTLTSRFENLLDREYQEIRGYRTPGFEAFFGLEFASL